MSTAGGKVYVDAQTAAAQANAIANFQNTTQTLSGPGAANTTNALTAVSTTGVGNAVTLAAGVVGQRKRIVLGNLSTPGDTVVITPSPFGDGTHITLSALFDSVELQWGIYGGGSPSWHVIALNGTAVVT